ncbi:hypothetical protein JT321_gp70 [Providencia phage Kokobel1]|uniref:Uncharacterized protein n=1 Tax=Providencia phage Kokobel1 TaxID=2783540 RepID=A0A873WWL1_9CAUD|nr:hypothetical protein JT321_gp70 [Providencia phage Kokobel1]QPB11497.1 hypothetical protein [Providencia phage Kokobel1]
MIKLMHYAKYDYRDPAQKEHRVYPVPDGIRVGVFVREDGVEVWSYDYNGDPELNLTGFAPHIEDICLRAWQWMNAHTCSLSGISGKEAKEYKSGLVIDGFFQDIRQNYGEANITRNQLDEWLLDEFESTDETKTTFMYAAVTTYAAAKTGRDSKDIAMRRANFRHALCASNNESHTKPRNICVSERVPRFTVWPMELAPQDWDLASKKPATSAWPAGGGIAWPHGQQFEDQLNSCFDRGFVGGLDIAVFQGWNTRTTAYQFITEDATL